MPELDARGHRAIAVDLPTGDPDAGLTRYAALTAAAIGDADDVVLVGHSLGAATIPLVARVRPVRHLVFLCALIPEAGMTVTDRYAHEDVFVPGFAGNTSTRADGASFWSDADAATHCLFHDCAADEAAWAVGRLRAQSAAPRLEPWPGGALPDTERTAIVCRDERCIRPEWSRRVAKQQLGVDAVELDGGHSPFLSRPAALADVLGRV